MRRAALQKVQLNRTHLAAEHILDRHFERAARARQIPVPENVERARLIVLADVFSVGETESLRDGDDDVRMLCERRVEVGIELFIAERPLGKVNEVGRNAADPARQGLSAGRSHHIHGGEAHARGADAGEGGVRRH